MEVHHHPHVEKKSFKEYLLEGLMIFLAVSMGFIAENIRERITHHEIETRDMEIILSNLQSDTAQLNIVINQEKKKLNDLDTVLSFKDHDLSNPVYFGKLFYHFVETAARNSFHSNDVALEQIKSSGSLRLIKSRIVLDSLFQFIHNNWLITDFEQGLMITAGKYFSISDKLFNYVKIPGKQISLGVNINNKEMLQEFYNTANGLYYNIQLGELPLLHNQLACAINLIALIKKEYHLEKE